MEEMKQSLYILQQAIDLIPKGDIKSDNHKITPPPRSLMKNYMESLIHHFKHYSEGYSIDLNEYYASVEAPKGEFGIYIYADGSNRPYRCRIKSARVSSFGFYECTRKKPLISRCSNNIRFIRILFLEKLSR
jgi:NADH:ubiquinone oxidoreductase subunit D